MATEQDLIRQLVRENLQKNIIFEGLIFSYSPSILIRKIKDMGYSSFYGNNSVKINFKLSEENKNNYKKINDLLNNVLGWHHGATIAGNIMPGKMDFLNQKTGIVVLQYEPKFDVEIDKVPSVLYHLTTLSKLQKILKKGLVPKSSDNFFSFENRIYLSENINLLYNFVKKKFFTNIRMDESDFVILEVKPDKRTRFFKDPNFGGGYYTLENLDKYSVNPIEKIELNQNGEIVKIENYTS